MAFTFPNPLDTTEFTAANGITYSWDNEDAKWRVKAYLPPKGPTVDLGPTPPLKPGGPSDGDLWFNTSPDDLTLYIYSEDTGTWIPAASVSALEERVAENEALQIQIVQRLQANEVLTNFHSGEITTIKNDIIELEEEIDSIAAASERGKWKFIESGVLTTTAGDITAYDQPADTSGNPTGLVQNIKSVWFQYTDLDGGLHSFENVEIGNLLELFVQGSDDYGLFEIVKINNYSSGLYWIFDVNFIRTLDATTRLDNDEVVRLKIFQAPTGGPADGFVLKSGDTMTGNLTIDKAHLNFKDDGYTLRGIKSNGANKFLFDKDYAYAYGRFAFQTKDASDIYMQIYADSNTDSGCHVRYYGSMTEDNDIVNKKYVDESVRPIQILPGNPPDAKVGDAWFSTNQNVFIIKVA